jgi:predicted short-subunit dehydrogenase-like oxidoreductase (DUF2520 family)
MRRKDAPAAAIVGAGAVGTALGRALARRGFAVRFASRRVASAQRAARAAPGRAFREPAAAVEGAELVFLTVPDAEVAGLAGALARERAFARGAVVLHTSGYLEAEVLAPARISGAHVGAMHPLQTFANPAAVAWKGVRFTIEGDAPAVRRARSLARALGGVPVTLEPERKRLYHAAAAVTSNFTVVVFDLAVELFRRATGEREAGAALLPLLRGTVANLERVGVPHALSGPIARGDLGVVRGHLEAIAREAPDALEIYRALAHRAVRVALAKKTIDEGVASALRALLSEART